MANSKEYSFKATDLLTLPNILTYIRLLLIAPFTWFFLREEYIPAAICIGISGLSDCLDGFFARKLNQVTDIGKMLDPIADKITLFAVVICMAVYLPIVIPVLCILLIKDVLMLIGGSHLIKLKINPPAAKWYGKAGTIVFYFSVCIIVFLKAVFSIEYLWLDYVLLTLTAVSMVFALYKYTKVYFNILRKNNKRSIIDKAKDK